jgi:hypothetical protein
MIIGLHPFPESSHPTNLTQTGPVARQQDIGYGFYPQGTVIGLAEIRCDRGRKYFPMAERMVRTQNLRWVLECVISAAKSGYDNPT